MSTGLGDRMKVYEGVADGTLTRRVPVILRVDGRAFHTITRGLEKPFSPGFYMHMQDVGRALVKEIQGAKLAYGQSDEVSVLITDYDTISTQPWFGYRVQKMCSIGAAVATKGAWRMDSRAMFDARVFNVPKDDVANYFIWRQKDATRNSILAAGQYYFSHNEMQGKSTNQVQDMLFTEMGVNWNDHYDTQFKRGWCLDSKGELDKFPPIFTQKREYIEDLVFLDRSDNADV